MTHYNFLAEIFYGKTLEFDEAMKISQLNSNFYKKRLWRDSELVSMAPNVIRYDL